MKTNNLKSSSFFSLLVAILLFTSCSKDIDLPNSDAEKLIGSWKWVESSGGFSGGLISPKTEGYTKNVEFLKNGSFKELRNNQWFTSMEYTFLKGKSINSSDPVFLINYLKNSKNTYNYTKQSFQFFGNDTLYLNDECYDCYGHLYIRE